MVRATFYFIMPSRTRAEMHIGLDLILETLNSTPSNRMDAAIKDYFLNATITKFVKNVIDKANAPDELKRIPFRILTYGDILNKYNDIYTLIKVDEVNVPTLPLTDDNYSIYSLPTDLFRFEASYSYVKALDCSTIITAATAPTVALSGTGAGDVDNGVHKYCIVFVYPAGDSSLSYSGIATVTVTDKATNGKVAITNIPLGTTGCTARKIYRTTAGGKVLKLLATISDNTTTTYVGPDNTADSDLGVVLPVTDDIQLPNVLTNTYDIISFNSNPYGGKGKYIGTILETNGLQLHHLQRYYINRIGIIYVKNPAILVSVPTEISCDLPGSVHDKIVEDTAQFIAAAVANGSYEHLLNESKNKN